jgi:DNA polymerase-3 subunit epsilon
MSPTFIEKFAFLDFEASSLDGDSWPIEVGLSWINADLSVDTYERLIRPAPDWPETAWSTVSAKVHNIPRRDLDDAPDVQIVARDLLAALGNRIALSDAPAYESQWLTRLMDAAGVTNGADIQHFHTVSSGRFSSLALDHLYERLELTHAPHRAGADSARLAKSWIAGLRIDGGVQS